MISVDQLSEILKTTPADIATGHVIGIQGPIITARLPKAAIGDFCTIEQRHNKQLTAQVVSFYENNVRLAPFDHPKDILPGATVTLTPTDPFITIPTNNIGHILDPLGRELNPQNGRKRHQTTISLQLFAKPPVAIRRKPIIKTFCTGIRSIDTLCRIGHGQRIALIAPAGAGKTSLLNMIMLHSQVDVTVVALVGERGREVNEFFSNIDTDNGKIVTVVSTSDEHPMRRMSAPFTATAIAEYYREQGKEVLLLVDSLTRTARAFREVGLAAGEIPVRHGFPSSVFCELPKLLERTGCSDKGSITAIYTLLAENESQSDPLAEEIKSLLDGHIVLSAHLANKGIYPAIDPVKSLSRLAVKLQSPLSTQSSLRIRKAFSRLTFDKDIIAFGGAPDSELAAAYTIEADLDSFLQQSSAENFTITESESMLYKLVQKLELEEKNYRLKNDTLKTKS